MKQNDRNRKYEVSCWTVYNSFNLIVQVKHWITVNEPFMMSVMGYGIGMIPPCVKDHGVSTYKVGRTALLAHASVYHLYQKEFKAI